MLGLALAMNLSYLNLPIFSFLSQISTEVSEKIDSLPDSTKRTVENTKWFKDAVEISKVKSLEKLQFRSDKSSKTWVPFKSWPSYLAFNVLFKFRFGKGLSILATAYTSFLIILGVSINIHGVGGLSAQLSTATPSPFYWSVFCFFWPIICVGLGAYIRYETIKELNYNLRDLGDKAIENVGDLIASAESAVKNQ